MPEGPEVETVRRSLLPLLLGATLSRPRVSRKKLRTAITARDLADVDGAVVTALSRKGKLLVITTDRGGGLFVRLGMTGQLVVEPLAQKPRLHTHVRLAITAPTASHPATAGTELRFIDPRRFGEVVPWRSDDERLAELGLLGPDGLSLDDDGRAVVADRLRATGRSIKDALLDQRVVAGVGNIYAAEACFVARLSPFRAGHELDDDEAARLVRAVEAVLLQGVQNRGTSFSDYVDGEGKRGENARHLHVFQREGEACRVCGVVVVREVQGARSTFFCPTCQG